MLNDRDEKDEGSDEPEYHFSEEEGEYLDTEIPKEEPAPAPIPPKTGGMGNLTPSKRMVISLVVFLVLVYIVYKMVAPTSQVPSTDITAPVTTAQTQAPKNPVPNPAEQSSKLPLPQAAPAPTSPAPSSNVIPVATTAPVQTAPGPSPSAEVPAASLIQQPMPNQPPAGTVSPAGTPEQLASGQQAVSPPSSSSLAQPPLTPQAPQPSVAQQQPLQQPLSQQQPLQQPLSQQQPLPQAPLAQPIPAPSAAASGAAQPTSTPPPPSTFQPVAGGAVQQQSFLPPVIPVQAPSSTYNVNAANGGAFAQNPSNETKITALEADSARLMNQLQSDYMQKLNDFSTQNRTLQEQVQTLNSRMATMEAQMNQLVQALTHQTQSMEAPAPLPPEQPSFEQRVSYNVQAIIPGRAWLRSDNGDTLTVAEGDMIKSLGRVTRIDPYDGVVEINTGKKVVSLSYGTGA